MRKALGIVRDSDREYWVNREISDFSLLLNAFLGHVRKGKLSSRSNAAEVIRYSDWLVEQTGVGDERVEPVTMTSAFREVVRLRDSDESESPRDEDDDSEAYGDSDEGDEGTHQHDDDDLGIRPRLKIGGTTELETAFVKSGSQKLQSLYVSITTLSLKQHCPIVTVGFWSLMESLAALHGGEGSTFDGHFSHQRLRDDFGFSSRDERKNIIAALKHLTSKGNSTKHSAIAASFDGNQVANDFDVLTPLMLAVLRGLPN